MATATQEQVTDSFAGVPPEYRPTDMPAHEADKARRAEERAKKAPILDQCLDPEFASRMESRKPLYEYEVSAKFSRRMPDVRGKERMTVLDFSEKIIAHNEQDAWSMFCDKIGHTPSPHKANRTIKRLNKIN